MRPLETEMNETKAAAPMVVVDIGKKSSKAIKRLRRGEGSLVPKLEEVIEEIRAGLSAGEAMPTVVVVVKEKPKPVLGFLR